MLGRARLITGRFFNIKTEEAIIVLIARIDCKREDARFVRFIFVDPQPIHPFFGYRPISSTAMPSSADPCQPSTRRVSIQVLLKSHKDLPDLSRRSQFADSIAHAVVLKFDQLRQLVG